MIQLIINNELVDLNSTIPIELTKQISDVIDPSQIKTNVSKSILLPLTKKNLIIFGFPNRFDNQFLTFNYSKKYNYVLLDGGVILQKGYVKVSEINSGIVCNLFSEEAEFFNKLGEKKVIDLEFNELNKLSHKLDKDFLNKNLLAPFNSDNEPIHNVIRYVPMLQGTYINNFDSKLVEVEEYQSEGETKYTKELSYEYDEFNVGEVKDWIELRSVNQKPAIFYNAIIKQILKENGYTLHSDFCVDSNPYWKDILILTKKYSLEKSDEVSDEVSELSKKGNIYYKDNITNTPEYSGISSIDDTLGIVNGEYIDLSNVGEIEFTIDLQFETFIRFNNETNQNINYVTFTSSPLLLDVGINQNIALFQDKSYATINLSKYKLTKKSDSLHYVSDELGNTVFNVNFKLKCKSYGEFVNELPIYLFSNLQQGLPVALHMIGGAINYENITSMTVNFNKFNINVRKITGKIIDNIVDISRLFSAELSQRDIITEYIKLFGLYLTVNDKDVYIQSRNNYFGNKNIIDWTSKVNLDEDISITPLMYDKKYLEFGYKDSTSTNFLKYFKNKYNKNYGSQIIDTGYEFNNEKNVVYNRSIITPIVPCQQYVGDTPITLLSSFNTDNEIRKGVDTNLHLIFDAKEKIYPKKTIKLTDETRNMISEGKYYWNGTNSNMVYFPESGESWLPKYNLIDSKYLNSLDWAKPNETLYEVTDSIYSEDITIFNKFHKNYIIDRYNANTKLIKLSIKLNKYEKNNLKLSDFIYLFGKYWTINLINYDITSDVNSQVELISVNNINNYVNGQSNLTPYIQIDTPNNIVIDSKQQEVIINVDTNVNWDIISSNELNISWLTITKTINQIKLNVNENINTNDRTGVIVIGNDIVNLTITIKQTKSNITEHLLTLSPQQVSVFWNNVNNNKITVNSNKSWKVVSVPLWITVPEFEKVGNGNGSFNFYCDKNYGEERKGKITVHTDNDTQGFAFAEVNITQQEYILPTISCDTPLITINADNTSPQRIWIVSNTDWEVINNNNWLTVTPSNGSYNMYINISANENETRDERIGNITLRTTNGSDDVELLISVKQKGKVEQLYNTIVLQGDFGVDVQLLGYEDVSSPNRRSIQVRQNELLSFIALLNIDYNFSGWFVNGELKSVNTVLDYIPKDGDIINGNSNNISE